MNKHSRLMIERIRRTSTLFHELGYEIEENEEDEESWSASASDGDDFELGLSIERDSKFVELSFSFSFPREQQDFLRDRIEEFMQISYQYGCYTAIVTNQEEIAISLFSKLYFAGLQYYALKETCRDLKNAVEELEVLFDVRRALSEGESDGYSEPDGR